MLSLFHDGSFSSRPEMCSFSLSHCPSLSSRLCVDGNSACVGEPFSVLSVRTSGKFLYRVSMLENTYVLFKIFGTLLSKKKQGQKPMEGKVIEAQDLALIGKVRK